jgi:5-hydroxyisourate hydrolase-like protein (transthyretin family)
LRQSGNSFVSGNMLFMKQIILLLWLLFFSLTIFAQTKGTVKGVAFDTLSRQPVAGVTVTVLKKKDSSLVSFTIADNQGRFELTNLSNGDYRLLITHVNYHNSNKYFSVDDNNRIIDFGQLPMSDKYKTLGEIVINAEAPPITMVDDTLQYNAGSFKVQPNANVEELLKKLPGVKVEKDGTVKAQGQTVNRVLVDGKEFFGNDPKIATRNLPADAVDKVQVFDRLSDQAQLTGFDDGNSQKAINLKLKKDKKKGLFGKVSAGAGTNERYEGRFNVNSFKGARQMSAIGMANNVNAEGFSFMDILNFTGELSRMQQGSGGNININISADDANAGMMGVGSNNNSAINTTHAGGINYNDVMGKKTYLTSNYFYNRFNPRAESNIRRQYFLPDSSYFYNQRAESNNISNSHRLNLSFDYQIDSLHSLKISPSLSYQDTKNSSLNNYSTQGEDQRLSNEGFSNNYSANKGFNFRNDLLFRKKFNRRGRTFSVSIQNSINESDGNGSLQSINGFYTPSGALIRTDSIKQVNNTKGGLNSYNIRSVYTEPFLKRSLIELSVSKSNSLSAAERRTFDYNNSRGKFDELNEQLSNDYENTYGYTNAGLRIRTQKKKYNWAVGTAWQLAELDGKILNNGKDSVIGKQFRNLLPNARFQYHFNRFKNINFTYSTFTNQPTITQLQPVPDISNPLNIRLGNPDLIQEYNHSLQLNYTGVNPFKNRSLFAFFTFTQTQNKIVNYDSVTALGVKFTRPVNADGVYNLFGNVEWGFPLRFIKATSLNIAANIRYNNSKQFINGSENNIRDLRLSPELRLQVNAIEKVDMGFGAMVTHNSTKYTLQPALNANYFSQQYETDFNWQLPANFFFHTDFAYIINNRRAAGFNTKIPLWNASVAKQFLKYNRGEIKLRVYDLLNQNIGVVRTSNNNYIEDARYTILRRYFMLAFTYSLSKAGLNADGNGGGIRIIQR